MKNIRDMCLRDDWSYKLQHDCCRRFCPQAAHMTDEEYDEYDRNECEYCPVINLGRYYELKMSRVYYMLYSVEAELHRLEWEDRNGGQAGEDIPGRDDGGEVPGGADEGAEGFRAEGDGAGDQ